MEYILYRSDRSGQLKTMPRDGGDVLYYTPPLLISLAEASGLTTFASYLIGHISSLGLNQLQAAKQGEISPAQMSQYVNGQVPGEIVMERLISKLGLDQSKADETAENSMEIAGGRLHISLEDVAYSPNPDIALEAHGYLSTVRLDKKAYPHTVIAGYVMDCEEQALLQPELKKRMVEPFETIEQMHDVKWLFEQSLHFYPGL